VRSDFASCAQDPTKAAVCDPNMAAAWAHDPSAVYALHAHTAAAQAAAAQAAAAQAAAAQAAAAQVAAAQAAAVVQQQAAMLQLQKQLQAQPPMPPPALSTQVPEQPHPQELPRPPEKAPERQPEWQHGQGSPNQNTPQLSTDPAPPAPPALRYAHQLHAPQHLLPPDAKAPPGLPSGFMTVPYPMAAPTTFVPTPHAAYHAPASLHALHFAPGQPMPLTAPMPFSPPPFAAAPPPPVPAPLPSTPATFAAGFPPEATIVPTAAVALQAVKGSEPAGASASVRPADGSMGELTPPHESPASPQPEPDHADGT